MARRIISKIIYTDGREGGSERRIWSLPTNANQKVHKVLWILGVEL